MGSSIVGFIFSGDDTFLFWRSIYLWADTCHFTYNSGNLDRTRYRCYRMILYTPLLSSMNPQYFTALLNLIKSFICSVRLPK